MEKFINYISFNLIPKHVLMKAPKKKNHINYAIRHRAKSLRTLYLEKSIEHLYAIHAKSKSFFVIQKPIVKHMITICIPKLL